MTSSFKTTGALPRRRLTVIVTAGILLVAGLTVGPTSFAARMAAGTDPTQGAFVIGDANAAIGSPLNPAPPVTFWGAQWWKDNSFLSGGLAPASFKGFADTASNPPVCGQTWTTRPGNSSNPPAAVGPLIDVIVSSAITKQGATISGDITKVVTVLTDPGYEGNPGHAGTGTVVGIVCGGGPNPD